MRGKPCASWIAPSGSENEKNYYFRARRAFTLSEIPPRTTARIAAESHYVLHLNGTEVGRGPARGNHATNYYDTHEITSVLRRGANLIAVLCHCPNVETFTAAPARPALLVEIEGILGTDGSWEVAAANGEWRRDSQFYSPQTGYSEWRDMREEPAAFSESCPAWEKAEVVDGFDKLAKKRLLPRPIPQLAEKTFPPVKLVFTAKVPRPADFSDPAIARLMSTEGHQPLDYAIKPLSFFPETEPVSLPPPADADGVMLLFDFGREVTGQVQIDLTAPEGAIVDLGYEEMVQGERLKVWHRRANGEEYNFADRFVLREGRQRIGQGPLERGFRFVQIVGRNFSRPIVIHQICAVDRRYPFVSAGAFQCSDAILNHVWEACGETLSACTTDIFTDCPWRERAFWVNDLLVENLVALQFFGDARICQRAFEMAFAEREADGFLPGVCPCPREGKEPDWLALLPTNLFITVALKDYLMYSGDVRTVTEVLPEIDSILEKFAKLEDEQGLITPPPQYWCFFDWSYELNELSLNGKKSCPLNCLHLIALETRLELARLTGTPVNEAEIQKKIARLSASLEATFFDRAAQRVDDYQTEGGEVPPRSQLSHALLLIAKEGSEELRTAARAGVNDPGLLVPDLYFHYFIFAALKRTGEAAAGLERIRKYWGEIVKTGSPTIWETGVHRPGKQAIEGIGSLCHGFSTSPVDFLQTVILGIAPLSPGFRTFQLNPVSAGLKFARGRIPTPAGHIEIHWERDGAHLNVSVKIPDGCEAVTNSGERLAPGVHTVVVPENLS